jgi:hypothetical protein
VAVFDGLGSVFYGVDSNLSILAGKFGFEFFDRLPLKDPQKAAISR